MSNFLKEKEIIERLRKQTQYDPSVLIGIGDDAAAVAWPKGEAVVSTVDQLVENIHFLPSTPARVLGYKSLVISLSDIAAMGARPRAALLTITSPAVTHHWLDEFAGGFFALAQQYNVALIGGNCTRGPLALSCTVLGSCKADELLKIDHAQAGDDIWVLGNVGLAAYAREAIIAKPDGKQVPENNAWYYPEPQLKQIQTIQHLLNSAVDISDGLYSDLQKLCAASCVGAEIVAEQLPRAAELASMQDSESLGFILEGGEGLCYLCHSSCCKSG